MSDKINEEEIKSKITKLKTQRDAYQYLENGISELSKYNKLTSQLGMNKIYPVMFFDDDLLRIQEPGIFKQDIQDITIKIIALNIDRARTNQPEKQHHQNVLRND